MSLRRRVGMVFQRPNPFPMSIFDNVVAGARAHDLAGRKELKEIARHRLTEVGLWDAVAAGWMTPRSGYPAASSNCSAWPAR